MAAISFVDQETEFRDWRKDNPDGYILNTTRVPSDKVRTGPARDR